MEKPVDFTTDIYEVRCFENLFRETVTPEVFHCHDAFFWFTIDGFVYFLPSLIRCSFIDLEKCLAAIEYILEETEYAFLSSYDYGKITEKWYALGKEQLNYVILWLKWLGEEEPSFNCDEDYKTGVSILSLLSLEKKNKSN